METTILKTCHVMAHVSTFPVLQRATKVNPASILYQYIQSHPLTLRALEEM